MRRANPVSVRVRGPSRGLVTRLPGESADLLRPGDEHKVSFVAQNMRYEDGVMRNAPGYQSAQFLSSIAAGVLNHYRMDDATFPGTRVDSLAGVALTPLVVPLPSDTSVTTVPGKLGQAIHWNGVPDDVALFGPTYDFHTYPTDFSFAFWQNEDNTGDGNVLLQGSGFRIVRNSGFDTFMVRDTSNTTYSVNSSTITAGVWTFIVCVYDHTAKTIVIYTNGSASAPVSVPNPIHPFFSSNFQVGANGYVSGYALDSLTIWNRKVTSGEVTKLYNGGAGIDWPFFAGHFSLLYQANLIGSLPNPLIGADGGNIEFLQRSFTNQTYDLTTTNLYTGTQPSTGYPWFATDLYNTILFAQHDNAAQYWQPPLPNVCQKIPGLPSSDAQWDGTEVFFGHVLLWKEDRMKWSDKDDFTNWIPVGQTATSAIFTIDTGGFTQPAVGGNATIPVTTDPTALVGGANGQFIFIQDNRGSGTANQFYNYYKVVSTATGPFRIVATLLDLTGVTPATDNIAAGQQVFTVDANEAGETRVVGSKMNGRIFKIIAMGDYAYIFKERSIQSVQYVGLDSGVFFIHPEVSNEGILSRTAALNLGDGRIVFMGHKELYMYTGGPNPQPICQQFTRQLIREIDRNRLDQIVMTHKEVRHEVWVTYPIIGGTQKTLIWNYVEDSASIDLYDTALQGITASEDVDFSTDTPWLALPDALTWANMDPGITWLDMAGASNDRILLLGTGDGHILVWGLVFNRDGNPYTALSETMDFDFDEPDIWKYVDVVALGLEITLPSDTTKQIFIQIGSRPGLGQDDAKIVWTAPVALSVAGNINDVVKVNPGGAGRYLRLRVYSQDVDVQWEVSSFEIHCRPGGLY